MPSERVPIQTAGRPKTHPPGLPADFIWIAVAWLALVVLIDPRGDFPTNDDWAFQAAVQQLYEHGVYRPPGWSAMSLVTNIAWGALFCIPAGCSTLALRMSGVVAGLIALWAVYALGRHLGARRSHALLGTANLAVCPLFLPLSLSFHTDVPFVALLLLATLAGSHCLQSGSRNALWALAGLSLAATLSRQLGLAVPLAVAICAQLQRGTVWRARVAAVLPLVVSAGALLGLQTWLVATHSMPALYQQTQGRLWAALAQPLTAIRSVAFGTLECAMVIGLMLIPTLLAVIAAPRSRPATWRANPQLWTLLATLGFSLLVWRFWSFYGRLPAIPMGENYLSRWGIGLIPLRGMYEFDYPQNHALPPAFWQAVQWAAFAAALLMTWVMTSPKRAPADTQTVAPLNFRARLLPLAVVALYTIPLMLTQWFDRYLLPAVALAIAVAVTRGGAIGPATSTGLVERWLKLPAAAASLAAITFYTSAGTVDMLQWHGLRWQLTDHAMSVYGATPETMDGGFEFNGVHLYDPHYVRTPDKSWYWVKDDQFAVSMIRFDGWAELKRLEYRSLLTQRTIPIILQRRPDAR